MASSSSWLLIMPSLDCLFLIAGRGHRFLWCVVKVCMISTFRLCVAFTEQPANTSPDRLNRVRQNRVCQSLTQDSATTIPCEVLIEETQHAFPAAKDLQILSIGTGLGDVVTIIAEHSSEST
jgi:hypothetical protein